LQDVQFEDQQVSGKKQHIKKFHYQFFGTPRGRKLLWYGGL